MAALHSSSPPPIDPSAHPFVTAPIEIQLLIASHLPLKDALALPQLSKACASLGANLRRYFGGTNPDENDPETQITNCVNIEQMQHTFSLLTPMILVLKQEQVLPKNAGTDWKELSLMEIRTALLWLKSPDNRIKRAPIYQMCRALYFCKKEIIPGFIAVCFNNDPLFAKVYKVLEHMKAWKKIPTNQGTRKQIQEHKKQEASFEDPLERAMVSTLLRHNGWRKRFNLLPESIQNNPLMRILLIAKNSLKLSQLTDEEKSEPATSLVFLQHSPKRIKFFPEYKKAEFVAKTFITKNPSFVRLFDNSVRLNRDLATYVVQHFPNGLKAVDEVFQKDRAFALEAIKYHPEAYMDVTEELTTNEDNTINEDFLLEAVEINNQLAYKLFRFYDTLIEKNFSIRLLNVIKDPFLKLELLSYASSELQTDSGILACIDFAPSD